MNSIDHLVYTAPSLEEGMNHIEKLLGMRPSIGGKHYNWGTHNALLSIGNAYLEIVAPCPELEHPERGLWLNHFFQKPPQLATWALQTNTINELRTQAIAQGIDLGEIQSGQREKPDGTMLKWQLTDPYALLQNGTLPFLINWQNSTHPSETAPKAGELKSLTIKHPHPDLINKQLEALEIDIEVIKSQRIALEANIETTNSLIILR